MPKPNLLITGVSGFIGSHLAKAALTEGYRVFGIDDFSYSEPKSFLNELEMIEADLAQGVPSELCKVDLACIFHLAGQASGEHSASNPDEDLRRNFQTTVELAKFNEECGRSDFFHASSMAVYGNSRLPLLSEDLRCDPISNYGKNKLLSELHLGRKKSFRSVSLRMFNVYGPGQSLERMDQGMVSIFLSQALNRGAIEVKGSLDRTRDFIYIDDVAEAWMRLIKLHNRGSHEAYNLGTGIPVKVGSLIAKIREKIDVQKVSVSLPTPSDQFSTVADMRKLKADLKWAPSTNIGSGLDLFLEHIRQASDSHSG